VFFNLIIARVGGTLSYDDIVPLSALHLVVVVLGAGVLVPRGPGRRPHGRLLGRSLDVRVLPGPRGPLLLSLGHAGPAAAVGVMDLRTEAGSQVITNMRFHVWKGSVFVFL